MQTLYHPTLPTSQDVPDNAVEDWKEQGWLTEPPAYADLDESSSYDPSTAKVKEILAHVGTSRERAIEGLTFERARGDAARPSLIEKLEKLANPAGTNQEGANA